MKNLLLLFKTYYRFFSFLLVQIFCLIIFVRNNTHPYQSYIHSAKKWSGKLYSEREKIRDYLNLREENQTLLAENAVLKSRLGIEKETNPLIDTFYSLQVSNDSVRKNVHYFYIPARVINNSIDRPNNYITLDMGSSKGVRKNMTVIGSQGIVGKVTHVSANYCLVQSALSKSFNVSCTAPDGTLCKVFWGHILKPEYATLTGIPQSLKLSKGDTIVTSGFSLFPQNIMVGKVVKPIQGGSTGIKNYLIRLSTEFRKLKYVYIVNDIITEEQRTLEDSAHIENE